MHSAILSQCEMMKLASLPPQSRYSNWTGTLLATGFKCTVSLEVFIRQSVRLIDGTEKSGKESNQLQLWRLGSPPLDGRASNSGTLFVVLTDPSEDLARTA
ncbi:hypothetical protein NPIL_332001 [Nephila pilipes]|uniref:Uncharacterized protein n=1 Tax=Nephila pilipes TaxID=299642 RepID=A0A8X6IQM5_NEPPI|nr:hypothetical protein NPIL_332001 [Nephila pilipes]